MCQKQVSISDHALILFGAMRPTIEKQCTQVVSLNLNEVFDHTIDIPVDPEPVPTDLGEPTVKGPFSSEQEHPYFHERPIRDYAPMGKSFPNHMELDCAKLLLKTVEVKFNITYHEIVL